MIRRPPRSTLSSSSAASDVYKRQPFIADIPRIDGQSPNLILIKNQFISRSIHRKRFLFGVDVTCKNNRRFNNQSGNKKTTKLFCFLYVYIILKSIFTGRRPIRKGKFGRWKKMLKIIPDREI